MEQEHKKILAQAHRKQALAKLETIAGLSISVTELKLGLNIPLNKQVSDLLADKLDGIIEDKMDDMIGEWNAYKKHSAGSDNSLAEMAPKSIETVGKAVETF